MTIKQNPHRCPDNGCVLLVPGTPRGAGTNGGCKCLNDPRGAERLRVRNGIRWLADRVTATDDTRGRLAAEVDEAHAALGAILPTMRAIREVLRCEPEDDLVKAVQEAVSGCDAYNELVNSPVGAAVLSGRGEGTQPAPTMSPESQPVMPALWRLLGDLGLAGGHPLRDLLEDREAKGLATYGATLHTHNGRDALRDCAEELADALVYTMQWALEGGDESQWAQWFPRLLRLAGEVAQAAADVEAGR